MGAPSLSQEPTIETVTAQIPGFTAAAWLLPPCCMARGTGSPKARQAGRQGEVVSTFARVHGGGGRGQDWSRLSLATVGTAQSPSTLPIEDRLAGWGQYADTVVHALGNRRDVVVVGHSARRLHGTARVRADPGRPPSPRRGDDPIAWRTLLGLVDQHRLRRQRARRCLLPRRPACTGSQGEARLRRHCSSPGRSRAGRTRRRDTCYAATTACSPRSGHAAMLGSAWA